MSEYESQSFEHLVEEALTKKNAREELDKMYPDNIKKLQVVKSTLKKWRLELEDLGSADSTNYGHEELARLEELPDHIAVLEAMEAELESQNLKDENIQDLGEDTIG